MTLGPPPAAPPAQGTHLQEAYLLDAVLPGLRVHHLKYLGEKKRSGVVKTQHPASWFLPFLARDPTPTP